MRAGAGSNFERLVEACKSLVQSNSGAILIFDRSRQGLLNEQARNIYHWRHGSRIQPGSLAIFSFGVRVLIREMEENGQAVVRIEEIRLDSDCRFKVFPGCGAVPFAPLSDSLLIFLDSPLSNMSVISVRSITAGSSP